MSSRLILHIDMNSYFASCEQQANPFLRGKSVGVCGKSPSGNYLRTVVAAASVEAKRLGVKTAMSTWEAKKVCPKIILIPGDPAKYLSTTKTFLQIFEKYTPIIEVFSIDEAFLDVTDTASRFGGPIKIAELIKKELRQKVGERVTCSIGVSHNKLLAKLASESKKPDGLTTLEPIRVEGFLKNIKLNDLCGIGPKILKRLNKLGIKTVRQLGECPEYILVEEFKSYGYTLKLMGQGIDPSPVIPYWKVAEPKSMGHSYTLPKRIDTFEKAKFILERLCEMVSRRLRCGGLVGRTIHLYIRREDFTSWGKQVSLPYPTDDGKKIFRTCLGSYEIENAKIFDPIRLVGVRVSGLSKKDQRPLFLFEADNFEDKLIKVTDNINNRYGEFTIFRAALLKSKGVIKEVAGYLADAIK